MNNPAQNTDRLLWPMVSEDAFADTLFVTAGGEGIGINVGGSVYVKPLKEWHRLAALSAVPQEPDSTRQVLQNVRNCLERVNNDGSETIADTIWYSGHETLFDYIDAELERVPGRGLPAAAPVLPAQAEQPTGELDQLRAQNMAMLKIWDAVANLVKVKGRHHSEQAYQRLVKEYDELKNDGEVLAAPVLPEAEKNVHCQFCKGNLKDGGHRDYCPLVDSVHSDKPLAEPPVQTVQGGSVPVLSFPLPVATLLVGGISDEELDDCDIEANSANIEEFQKRLIADGYILGTEIQLYAHKAKP